MLQVFPLAHKYDFVKVLHSLNLSVAKHAPSLCGSQEGPTSLMVWLQLAESLQLDELKTILLSAVPGWSDDEIHILTCDTVGLSTLNKSTVVQLLGAVVKGRLKLSEAVERSHCERSFQAPPFDPTGYMNCG